MNNSSVLDNDWVTGNGLSFLHANAASKKQTPRDVGVLCENTEILSTSRWEWNGSVVASVLWPSLNKTGIEWP